MELLDMTLGRVCMTEGKSTEDTRDRSLPWVGFIHCANEEINIRLHLFLNGYNACMKLAVSPLVTPGTIVLANRDLCTDSKIDFDAVPWLE